MRRGAAIAVFVLTARAALGCGQVLTDSPDEIAGADASTDTPAPAVDGGPSGDADTPLDAPIDVGLDVGPSCRPVFLDDFEQPAWETTHTQSWPNTGVSNGTVARDPLSHKGAYALAFATPTRDDHAFLLRPLSGPCALTLDFWVLRKAGATNGVIFLELVAGPGRVRHLRTFGGILVLDAENANTDAEGSRSVTATMMFSNDVYHHIVLRYALSGAMTLSVDDGDAVPLGESDGPAQAATQLRIGNLGGSGTDPNGNVLLFDDVLIY